MRMYYIKSLQSDSRALRLLWVPVALCRELLHDNDRPAKRYLLCSLQWNAIFVPDICHACHHDSHRQAMHKCWLHPSRGGHILNHWDASDEHEKSSSNQFTEAWLNHCVERGGWLRCFFLARQGSVQLFEFNLFLMVCHGPIPMLSRQTVVKITRTHNL